MKLGISRSTPVKQDMAVLLRGRPAADFAPRFICAALVVLLVVSFFEAFAMIARLGRQAATRPEAISIVALLLALIPSVTIAVCMGEAILLQSGRFPPARRNRRLWSARHQGLTRGSGRKAAGGEGAGPAAAERSLTASRTQRGADTALWMGAAFFAALALAIAVLAVTGTNQRGIGAALRATGRLSLLLFWPAYAGGATAAFFGPRFAILLRHGREFGLAYASAQLVHFGLVGWLLSTSDGPLAERLMPFFAVGIVWTYLLALSSTDGIGDMLGTGLLPILRTAGVEYIALLFFADFVLSPIGNRGGENLIVYLPFSVLISVGLLLRAAAWVRRRRSAPSPQEV
jgi:hypothetical protein